MKKKEKSNSEIYAIFLLQYILIERKCIESKDCIPQHLLMINPETLLHKWIDKNYWHNEPRDLCKTIRIGYYSFLLGRKHLI